MDNTRIPARIKAARHLAGLTSTQALADELDEDGLRVTRLNKIEQGATPAPRDLEAIAQACGLEPEWFTADLSRIAELAPPDHRKALAKLIAEADQRQTGRSAEKPSETQPRPAEGLEP